jgi:hypothetical protein
MSTLTTILGSDTITSSRTVLNANMAALNTDKIETSVIDTDTALTANSDSKIASQKAIRAYVDARGANANVTVPSRFIGTVYQNTSGKAITVAVTISVNVSTGNSGGADAIIGVTATPNITVGSSVFGFSNGSITQYGQVFFVVPNNYYYKMSSVSSGCTLVNWIEYTS